MHSAIKPLKMGMVKGLSIVYDMVKVIVPCYIGIEFMKHFGLIEIISRLFRPFMKLFGLPGEAALGLIAGYFINLYAAIAVLTPLNLSGRQITVMALILGISHSLPIETSVTQKTGVSWAVLLGARIGLSLISGVFVNIVWTFFS